MHLPFSKHTDPAPESAAPSETPSLNPTGAPITMRSVAWLDSRKHLPPALEGRLGEGFWKRPRYMPGVLVLEHDVLWFITEFGPVLELPIAPLDVHWNPIFFGSGVTVTVPSGDAKGQEGKYFFLIAYDYQSRQTPLLPEALLPMIAGTPFDDDRPSLITFIPISKGWKHAFAAYNK